MMSVLQQRTSNQPKEDEIFPVQKENVLYSNMCWNQFNLQKNKIKAQHQHNQTNPNQSTPCQEQVHNLQSLGWAGGKLQPSLVF